MTAANPYSWGDRQRTVSVAIASGTTGDTTLFTPSTSASWVVFNYNLQNTDGSNTTTFLFKAGSTAKTGTFSLAAGASASEGRPPHPLIVSGERAATLVLNKTGSGTLHGWVTYGEAERL